MSTAQTGSRQRFFRAGPASDRYAFYRDATAGEPLQVRLEIERKWARVSRFLDRDLPIAAMHDFPARYWEMELAETLLVKGIALEERSGAGGPDLRVLTPRCWVEAIVPGPGSNNDRVPSPLAGSGWVNQDQVILRFRAAIKEKNEKYLGYTSSALVSPTEPFVIAINGDEVGMALIEPTIPYIVSTVLPFGNLTITFDSQNADATTTEGYAYRSEVRNSRGAPVSTTAFADSTHSGISAVLYARANEAHVPRFAGEGYSLVHNPTAVNPLRPGTFPFGREYFADQLEGGWHLRWCEHPVA